ncbi:histidine phosphatase family protein [uncultured Winogradskyella sp.]|uniref:SixA phosphatase family protein n=1 Tax=uncultured Winogradskyella sp. TaxID=395353 RepID=UPI0026166CC1|nr:histidine phosphatase family protein [uncultured Winogradskyella sp.]
MKTVTLVRHGKSSWEYDVSDIERPLKSRGEKDAKLVANQFIMSNSVPKKIFSSPAIRALETCKIFIEAFNLSENFIEIDDSLYDFGGDNVVNFLKNLPNEIDEIMIFGHNHAFTSITNIFGDKFIDNLPTSGLVKLNFEISNWQDLKQGHTEFIIIPRELKK